jgi:hypothetical protein
VNKKIIAYKGQSTINSKYRIKRIYANTRVTDSDNAFPALYNYAFPHSQIKLTQTKLIMNEKDCGESRGCLF